MRGLEFNPSVSNLLASGAGESDVFITDLSNPSSPSVYSPGAKSNAPPVLRSLNLPADASLAESAAEILSL